MFFFLQTHPNPALLILCSAGSPADSMGKANASFSRMPARRKLAVSSLARLAPIPELPTMMCPAGERARADGVVAVFVGAAVVLGRGMREGVLMLMMCPCWGFAEGRWG